MSPSRSVLIMFFSSSLSRYDSYLPLKAQREKWSRDGKKDLRHRAEKKVRKILAKPEVPAVDPKTLKKILKEIPGIQSGVFRDRGTW